MKQSIAIACATAALLSIAPAHAATLLNQPASTGITASPGTRTYTFDAGGGTGALSFDLDGYLSIDGSGASGFDDLFTLTLNGTVLSSAYFRLGGIGNTQYVSGAQATTVTDNGNFLGGRASYALNTVNLLSGTNTLTFAYTSAVPQGTGDEGWGLRNVLVTGDAMDSAVPEPATWATMMIGFGVVGAAMRRRRQVARIRFA